MFKMGNNETAFSFLFNLPSKFKVSMWMFKVDQKSKPKVLQKPEYWIFNVKLT